MKNKKSNLIYSIVISLIICSMIIQMNMQQHIYAVAALITSIVFITLLCIVMYVSYNKEERTIKTFLLITSILLCLFAIPFTIYYDVFLSYGMLIILLMSVLNCIRLVFFEET